MVVSCQVQSVDALFVLGIEINGVLPISRGLINVHHDVILIGVCRQPDSIDASHPCLVGIESLILEHQVHNISAYNQGLTLL